MDKEKRPASSSFLSKSFFHSSYFDIVFVICFSQPCQCFLVQVIAFAIHSPNFPFSAINLSSQFSLPFPLCLLRVDSINYDMLFSYQSSFHSISPLFVSILNNGFITVLNVPSLAFFSHFFLILFYLQTEGLRRFLYILFGLSIFFVSSWFTFTLAVTLS